MKQEKQPLLSPIMRWFLFAMVLANIASGMYGMLLPVYMTELGASVGQVGMVFTISSLVPLVLQIFGGWLSDTIGRLRTIAIGSVGGVLSHLVMVLAPSWEWILLAVSLGFIARSTVGPSFGAFIADQSTEENRGRVFGISEMIYMVVDVVGPPLGGFLAFRFGFRPMLIVSGVLYTSAAVLRFWMAGTARRTTEANPEKLSVKSLRTKLGAMASLAVAGGLFTWILVTDGIRDIAFRMSHELEPLYLAEVGGLSVEQIGFLGSIFGIAMMVTTVPSGWLADKRGERTVILGGFALEFLGFVVFLQAKDFLGFGISWFIFGTGIGMMAPAYDSLVSKVVPENMRATAFGLIYTSLGVISLPAPWIGARLWEGFNPRLPFIITAGLVLLSVIPVWFKFRLEENGEEAVKLEAEGALPDSSVVKAAVKSTNK